jgi:putative DNA primase/helicase
VRDQVQEEELGLVKPDWVLKERRITVGCIVSDDFLAGYYRIHNPLFFKSPEDRRVVEWCIDYWKKFSEAPGQYIQEIWREAQETQTIPAEEAELIGKKLEGLSERYSREESDFSTNYELESAVNYFRNRQIELAIEAADELSKQGKFEEAEKALADIKPIGSAELIDQLEKNSLTGEQMLAQEIHRPERLIGDWLSLASLNMLYAPPGVGKTMLALSLSIGITRKEWMDFSIGPWDTKKPCGVLYVDGEMGEWDLRERIRLLSQPYGKENPRTPLIIASANRIARIGRTQINLSIPEWRDTIYEFLAERPRIKCVVIDNLSSLTPGRDENNKQEWDPINQWLMSLRHLGLAVIVVHHAGKNKKVQRGTSGHDDQMDVVLSLSRKAADSGAKFYINFQKARNLAPGASVDSFKVELVGNNKSLEWQEIDKDEEDEK